MKVQHKEGNNVNIIKEGKVTSVPIQRTQPAGGRQVVRNIQDGNDKPEDKSDLENPAGITTIEDMR